MRLTGAAAPGMGGAMSPPALGRHLLLDLYGCPAARLDDVEALAAACADAVRASGGTLLGVQHHRFSPHGATVVALVAESHLAVHTWPEHGYAGIDYFTCGDHVDPALAAAVLVERLAPARQVTRTVLRGDALQGEPGA